MQKLLFSLIFFVMFTALVGCIPTTRTYSVSVRNDAAEPMTVWLTKDGPPAEAGWLSPEQIVINGMVKSMPIGAVVPAGKTADMVPVDGKFHSGTNAVLRVYRGQKLFDNLLAIGSGSPNRTDVMLEPGENLIVVDKTGKSHRQ
ncbi:MAG: hypothetical protein H7144_07350 [Burkholderiales bacterium]|nr:hypothetical protein [Phycisphaerae bacterium]